MLVKRRLILITIAYWVFLVYIIVALVWWFIALEKQNREMSDYKLGELVSSDDAFSKKKAAILNDQQRNTTQYISEGVTFLALIILGAIFMYRAVRRQFVLQRQQENLMMAITHELKTPIAVAMLNLETLQKHHLDEQKKQRLIEMTLQETNRLNALAWHHLVLIFYEKFQQHSFFLADLHAFSISCGYFLCPEINCIAAKSISVSN